MDISKPVGTEIVQVDFGFLDPEEIRRLSVKQIVSPQIFDNLGHPISGGLYDLALGAFLKHNCATCRLDERFCQGHMGHIELPIPIYNPMFFSQMYILLRSTCLYCHHFKLKSLEVHRYACKLELLSHGFLIEANEIDNLHLNDLEENDDQAMEIDGLDDSSAFDSSKNTAVKDLIQRRNNFVQNTITNSTSASHTETPAVLDARKQIIHQFMRTIVQRPKCDNCGMYSPSFRKDGFVKLFEVGLNGKQITNNRIKGLERKNVMFDSTDNNSSQKLKTDPNEDIEMEDLEIDSRKSIKGSRYVFSTEVLNHLKRLFKREAKILSQIFRSNSPSNSPSPHMFFLESLPVPPIRFRPPSKVGDEIHENTQNEVLSKILQSCVRIKEVNDQVASLKSQNQKMSSAERSSLFSMLTNAFVQIQDNVNNFIDNTKSTSSNSLRIPPPGIKQTLEKKEGLFRKNMMGKRVNYAARSVISPDPMLETNEIGVPPVFAVKLTYPEPVTSHNFQSLRSAVINGPNVWPGATHIQSEDGSLIALHSMTVEQRTALANQLLTPSSAEVGAVNKKVFRHIRDYDVVLMNRQPTLHKASMMGHKVRVLPGEKTLRLHYANTGAYNADFDGDEMNMHFPQNENARAEAMLVASTDSQYITPTSGKPLRGLIQDHVSTGVWLTNKQTMFTREEYQQLIYGSIRPEDGNTNSIRIRTVPPAVIKPKPLWTGKQVITTILLNIRPQNRPGLNLVSKCRIKSEYWGAGSQEETVIFKNGELLCGILDKSQFGASDHGMVHAIHEIYGAVIAGRLLSVLGRLFTKYVQHIGFTCGMDDLFLNESGEKWRKEILQDSSSVGLEAAVKVANLEDQKDITEKSAELKRRLQEIYRDDDKLAYLDMVAMEKVNAVTSKIVSTCVPAGTLKKFPENAMQAMALSGAKGTNVNVSQVMCCLGQQALEGRRVPLMISGKSLPSFKPYETKPIAGGYITGRFFSGIKPQEYYFHCMAGREGLIDTAVKTSRSGYLQRCLIKPLEGVSAQYDNTVRDSDGTLIQFLYGGDGIDITKESYLRDFNFCLENFESLREKHQPSASIDKLNTDEALSYAKKVKKELSKKKLLPHYSLKTKYDPVISKFSPTYYLGSVSDSFQQQLDAFIKKNDHLFVSKKETKDSKRKNTHSNKMTTKMFKALMHLKYMQSVVDAGEALGIIASQSIGEPSTQMTLNTFHFAGHGAANVTLGIPRMREIIMTASSKIKTPQMYLSILDNVDNNEADIFAKSVTKVLLSEFIDNVQVSERITRRSDGIASRSYSVKINFFTEKEYLNEYDIGKRTLELVLKTKFLRVLSFAVAKEIKRLHNIQVNKSDEASNDALPSVGTAVPESQRDLTVNDNINNAGTSAAKDDMDEDDGDAEIEMLRQQTKEAASYDGPDDEEKEIIKENLDNDYNEEFENDNMDKPSKDDNHDDDSDSTDSEAEAEKTKLLNNKNNNGMSKKARERQQAVIGMHAPVAAFNFDDSKGEWCTFELKYPLKIGKLIMVNIIESVCQKVVVREIPGIGRCIRTRDLRGPRQLVTEGVNFRAMWEAHDFIDVNSICANDVVAVLKVYGVEAARNTIINEINKVFETYAITVNLRHLELIADMMTREGTYLPFNRQGIDTNSSPFLKMSFETTCGFLQKAVLNGDTDHLESPSARLVVGKVSKVGTGSIDILLKA